MRECDSIANMALEHVGKTYKITRELRPQVIDCSTLISQSHWTGAAVQTPFIAETQRLAGNGIDLPSRDSLLPGDLLFAYPSAAASPGRRHNHVGLYLGPDIDGEAWVAESRDPYGVMFTLLDGFRQAGPIRRFAPNPTERFVRGRWFELAARVPKLGRLGSRLTAHYTDRSRHSGLDLYVAPESVLSSPLTGVIVDSTGIGPDERRVTLADDDDELRTVMAPVRVTSNLGLGDRVCFGEPIGRLGASRLGALCNTVAAHHTSATTRLHWEVWTNEAMGSPAPELRAQPAQLRGANCELWAHNPLYLLKLGKVGSPIAV